MLEIEGEKGREKEKKTIVPYPIPNFFITNRFSRNFAWKSLPSFTKFVITLVSWLNSMEKCFFFLRELFSKNILF